LPFNKMRIVGAKPLHYMFGFPGAALVVPGDSEEKRALKQAMANRIRGLTYAPDPPIE
jgi:hypothetical protein